MKHFTARRFAPLLGSLLCVMAGGWGVVRALPVQAAPQSEKLRARDRVRWFYAWYVGQLNAGQSPLENRAKMAEFTSKRLNRWLHSAAYQDYGADYLMQAQDFDADWTRATVKAVTVSGNNARVAAVLGAPKPRGGGNGEWRLNLKMVRENGVWKIDEVDAPDLR